MTFENPLNVNLFLKKEDILIIFLRYRCRWIRA